MDLKYVKRGLNQTGRPSNTKEGSLTPQERSQENERISSHISGRVSNKLGEALNK
jgi:hypothetical protein